MIAYSLFIAGNPMEGTHEKGKGGGIWMFMDVYG
jgi:hypothetical protein